MAKHTIYKLYAELDDCELKIWRHFEIDSKITLAKLGYILLTLFEMKAEHLFAFEMVPYELVKIRADFKSEDAVYYEEEIAFDITTVRVKDLITERTKNIKFMYDFGDGWEFTLKLEEIQKSIEVCLSDYPRVLDGEGFGIIEDCGGTGGLETLVTAFETKGDGYEEYVEWLGIDNFDITAFDKEDMNFRLKKLPRIFKDMYEYELYPTRKSIAILEREYLKK